MNKKSLEINIFDSEGKALDMRNFIINIRPVEKNNNHYYTITPPSIGGFFLNEFSGESTKDEKPTSQD